MLTYLESYKTESNMNGKIFIISSSSSSFTRISFLSSIVARDKSIEENKEAVFKMISGNKTDSLYK